MVSFWSSQEAIIDAFEKPMVMDTSNWSEVDRNFLWAGKVMESVMLNEIICGVRDEKLPPFLRAMRKRDNQYIMSLLDRKTKEEAKKASLEVLTKREAQIIKKTGLDELGIKYWTILCNPEEAKKRAAQLEIAEEYSRDIELQTLKNEMMNDFLRCEKYGRMNNY